MILHCENDLILKCADEYYDGGLTLLVLVALYTGLEAAFEKQLDFEIFIPLSELHFS